MEIDRAGMKTRWKSTALELKHGNVTTQHDECAITHITMPGLQGYK
jgi:hypothetical protein